MPNAIGNKQKITLYGITLSNLRIIERNFVIVCRFERQIRMLNMALQFSFFEKCLKKL